MSSAKYPLRNSGIYRNLPTFDPSIKGLTALICGGTGIPGFHTLRALLDSPERWSTIFVLSRSPLPEQMSALLTEDQRQRTKHISINLQDSAEEIAQNLRKSPYQAKLHFLLFVHDCEERERHGSKDFAKAL
ncbi:hypothetical protein CERZMDRAFT_92621 [Cercospora zeae-maydis SCOH1-5]|uniref:Ketoreductase (KR) domain-containing protein n=1 Tax=Cercospora zeae-maydis SCOH1-5 TaxID=717836 RepID=A0A6A6FX63_9PEZI|nr:hypothetical protein CERZMDRAFT_92621 [Cercospora zeae-maydis SCOH1-5]